MAILVTGGTGFIGSHLVDTLVVGRERVKVLIRKSSKTNHLKKIGVELVVGDLRNLESVEIAMKGSDIVFHVAAAPDWKPEKEHWYSNYLGTVNMLKAALKQGIQRFVHCSTIGVLGFTGESPLSENSPYSPSPYSPYAKTKCEAEKKARSYYKKGLPITILRIAQVYGPRSVGTMGLGFTCIRKGIFPLIGGGKALLQPIYVQDVVEALIIAMKKDRSLGQVYNIAGEEILSFEQFFSVIAEAFEVNPPRIQIPEKFFWMLGYLLELKSRILGGKAVLTRFRAECVTKNMIYDISKAKEELGFFPKVGIEEGVRRTVEWYKDNGSLKLSKTSLEGIVSLGQKPSVEPSSTLTAHE